MTRREIKAELRAILRAERFYRQDRDGEEYASLYLGSVLSLDPCGRYHHVLSPNGATMRCIRYWENLEETAEELGAWIETGEGDACNVYLCRAAREDDIVEK